MNFIRIALLAGTALLANATASDLNFVLKNETTRSFEAAYLSAAGDNDWNANLLRKGDLPSKGSVEIRFVEKPDTTLWDLNLVDDEGLSVAFKKINLLDAETVIIRTVDGEITAVVE